MRIGSCLKKLPKSIYKEKYMLLGLQIRAGENQHHSSNGGTSAFAGQGRSPWLSLPSHREGHSSNLDGALHRCAHLKRHTWHDTPCQLGLIGMNQGRQVNTCLAFLVNLHHFIPKEEQITLWSPQRKAYFSSWGPFFQPAVEKCCLFPVNICNILGSWGEE